MSSSPTPAQFEIYADPTTSPEVDFDSATGFSATDKVPGPNDKLCKRCSRFKNKRYFTKGREASASALNATENTLSIPVKYLQECILCREKRQKTQTKALRSEREKSDASRLQLMNEYSWERVVHMIEDGCVPMMKQLLISDFYPHLPTEISNKNQRLVAEYVVDRFSEAEGFQFSCKKTYTLSKRARGHPSMFADAVVFQFKCSQQRRAKRPPDLSHGKTRNRRARVAIFDCNGSITVTFPSLPTSFDIAVEFKHTPHPGREQFGVPLKVRQWIKDHPSRTPATQREELMTAIKKGELEGVENELLSPTLIYYWWKKGIGEKSYPSNESESE